MDLNLSVQEKGVFWALLIPLYGVEGIYIYQEQ